MNNFRKITVYIIVLAVAAASALAMANREDLLIYMQPHTEILTQNGEPLVSVYSVSNGEKNEIPDRIVTKPSYTAEEASETEPATFCVTEYRGKPLKKAETMVFEPTAEYVKPIGRTVFEDGLRYMSMSGSGVEFDCEGEWADVQLAAESERFNSIHQPRVAVLVNGVTVFDRRLTNNDTHVRVDLGSCGGRAVVRVLKLSESMYSFFAVGDITVRGKRPIAPTAPKRLKLEFIGDSITSGFGIDEPNKNGAFSTATENFSKTYAYMSSSDLNADYSAVSYAGYGVLSGFSNAGEKSDAVFFDKYDRAIDIKSFGGENSKAEWSFEFFVPDIVVINLGTNDASYCRTTERRMRFVGEYKRLLSLVREKNPEAYILCVLGDMNNSLYPYIEQAAQEHSLESGDSRLECTKINFNIAQNGSVITGHPNEKANRSAADDLTAKIREIVERERVGE